MLEKTIDTIPLFLLVRTLLQTFAIPKALTEQYEFLGSIRELLQSWGQRDDLGGFLNECLKRAIDLTNDTLPPEQYWWRDIEVVTPQDFEFTLESVKQDISEAPIGVRVQLIADTLRDKIPLKFNIPISPTGASSNIEKLHKKYQSDPTMIFHNNSYTPVQTICDGVSEYFTQGCLTQPSEIDLSIIQSALDLAKSCLLARPDEVRAASAKQVNGHSNVTRNETVETMDIDDSEARMYGEYTLFAAFMTLQNPRRNSRQLHRLYVKDYTDESQRWKVYYSDGHGEQSITIAGDQAIQDIRGQSITTSLHSSDRYRPAYIVYVNTYLAIARQASLEEAQQKPLSYLGKRKVISDEDYFSDYETEDFADGDVCKYCLIGLDVDGNKLFICDACNQYMHQLCETPHIRDEEIFIDPWLCRECTAAGRKPIMNVDNK